MPNWPTRSRRPMWRSGSHDRDTHRPSVPRPHDHARRRRCRSAKCRARTPPGRMPGARASTSPARSRPRGRSAPPWCRSPPVTRSRPCSVTRRSPSPRSTPVSCPSAAGSARTWRSPIPPESRRSSTCRARGSSPDEVAAVVEATVAASARRAPGSSWPARCLPALADDFYVRVIRAVRDAHGAAAPLIAVDTSGGALAAVVAEGAPDLIKPNDDELAELAGTRLDGGDPAAVLDVRAIARAGPRRGRAGHPRRARSGARHRRRRMGGGAASHPGREHRRCGRQLAGRLRARRDATCRPRGAAAPRRSGTGRPRHPFPARRRRRPQTYQRATCTVTRLP